MTYAFLHWKKIGGGGNEVERTGEADIKKAEFLAEYVKHTKL